MRTRASVGLGEHEGAFRLYMEDGAETNEKAVAALKHATRAAMCGLTERQREVLELRYFKGMKQNEIAALWGVDKSAVSRHISRAKSKIKNLIVVQ